MLTFKRVPGWRTKLAAALQRAPAIPFLWGEHDCCLGLSVPSIEAVIGIDLGGPYRGQYSTAPGALLMLKRHGFDSLVDLADSQFKRTAISMARAGDIAALDGGDTGWALGVVTGPRIAVLSPSGFATVDLLTAKHCYRVG